MDKPNWGKSLNWVLYGSKMHFFNTIKTNIDKEIIKKFQIFQLIEIKVDVIGEEILLVASALLTFGYLFNCRS